MMEKLPDPEWLSISFLDKVLQSLEKKKKVELVRWSCGPAVPVCNNYLSQMYRVTVNYIKTCGDSAHSATIIVKVPLESGPLKEFVDSVKGYEREVKIYQEVLPAMYEQHSCRLTAQLIDIPQENFLVLEDLQEQGYKMVDRLKQLDAAHCRQSLLTLAKFHALSVAVHRQQPDLIQDIGKQLYFTENSTQQNSKMQFYQSGLNEMLNTIKKLDGCENYAELLHHSIGRIMDVLMKRFNPNGLNVLNHGDAWTCNILFKYDDSGKVTDAKLVDFQISEFCLFSYDLIYFWWTSANDDVREHHKEEMFEVYRQILNKTLEELESSKRLSKEEFDCNMKACAPFSLVVISNFLSTVMIDPDHPVDLNKNSIDNNENESNNNSNMTSKFQSKYYKAILPNVLRQVEAFGAFK